MLLHRSKLIAAHYNPRATDPYARQGLLKSIQGTGGLVELVVWNRRTGNIVGGHQRIQAEDVRNGTEDYYLPVNVVDWDDKTEREVNIRLNNRNIQGVYDVELLDALLRDTSIEIDLNETGFDMVSLDELYLQAGMDSPDFLYPDPEPEEADDIVDAAAAAIDEAQAAKAAQEQAKAIAEIKAAKIKGRERGEFLADSDIAISVVFPTSAHKAAFLDAVEKPGAMMLDGITLSTYLKLDLEKHLERHHNAEPGSGEQSSEAAAQPGASGDDPGRDRGIGAV